MGRDVDDRFERLLRSTGLAVLAIWREASLEGLCGVRLTELRVKLDADNGTSVLVIAKGMRGDEKVIGFVGANTLDAGLIALRKKMEADAVRWREDLPYGGAP